MKYEVMDICQVKESQLPLWFSEAEDADRERLQCFRRKEDFMRSLCADHLARNMLAKELGCLPAELHFCRTEKGKPYLSNAPLHFSLSHSGNYVLCAVHAAPIGADLERLRPIRPELCRRVCTEEEKIFVHPRGKFDSTRFLQVWTAKEALLKQCGSGISSDLRSISVVKNGQFSHPDLQFYQQKGTDYILTIAY